MTASPIVLVADGGGPFTAFTDGKNVTPGNTISVKLQSTTDVTQWTLQIFGVDEVTATAPSLTGVNPTTHVVTTPGTTVTFTMPSGSGIGRAIIFRSAVNGGGSGFTANFGLYTLTTLSRRVGAVGERLEGDDQFGWASTVNSIIRAGGGGGGLPPLANEQYAVLMEDPAGVLQFQKLDISMIDGGGGGSDLQAAYDAGDTITLSNGTTPVRTVGAGSTDQHYAAEGPDGVTFYNADRLAYESDYSIVGITPAFGGTSPALDITGAVGPPGDGVTQGGNGGNIGIGSGEGGGDGGAGPGSTGSIDIFTPLGADASVGDAGTTGGINIYTGQGGNNTGAGFAGYGGDFQINLGSGGVSGSGQAGDGGEISINTGHAGFSNTGSAGVGGSFTIQLGNGGSGPTNSGNGGGFTVNAGLGGNDEGAGAGQGGGFSLLGRRGGNADTVSAGLGGTGSLEAGQGGNGSASVASGNGGNLDLSPGRAGDNNGGGLGNDGSVRVRSPAGLQTSSELRLHALNDTNYVGFRAPNTVTTSVTYQLPPEDGASGSALTTNGAGVLTWGAGGGAGTFPINVTQLINSSSPVTIHTYSDPEDEERATVCYELLVSSIGPLGGSYSCFKLVAVFERDGSTFTERDVTFINGPVRSNAAFDVTFNLSGLDINLQVTGLSNGNDGIRWRAVGTITVVEETFSEP